MGIGVRVLHDAVSPWAFVAASMVVSPGVVLLAYANCRHAIVSRRHPNAGGWYMVVIIASLFTSSASMIGVMLL